jgi:hypothetical protein
MTSRTNGESYRPRSIEGGGRFISEFVNRAASIEFVEFFAHIGTTTNGRLKVRNE